MFLSKYLVNIQNLTAHVILDVFVVLGIYNKTSQENCN